MALQFNLPTQDQLNNRLNPQSFDIANPTGDGLFRIQGDFGTQLFRKSGNNIENINLIDSMLSPTEKATYGDTGGQAREAINRLSKNYGIDYNSLNAFNAGDLSSQAQKLGLNTGQNGQFGNLYSGDINSFFGSKNTAQSGVYNVNNTPNTLNTTYNPSTWSPTGPVQKTGTSNFQSVNPELLAYANGQQVNQVNPNFSGVTTDGSYGGNQLDTISNKINDISNLIRSGNVTDSFGNKLVSSPAYDKLNINIPDKVSYSDLYKDSNGNPKVLTINDLLNNRSSFEDYYSKALKDYTDAQNKLLQLKTNQLQANSNAMSETIPQNLIDMNLEQIAKKVAYESMPLETAKSTAQNNMGNALDLYKLSPQYQNQIQGAQTLFNLMQSYPDAGILPTDDIVTAQNKVSRNSARFQSQQSVIATNPLTGQQYIMNKMGGQSNYSTPNQTYPSTPSSTYQPTSGQTYPSTFGQLNNVNIPKELKPSLSNVFGVSYFDAGKINSNQLPSLQRISADSGIPILSKEDANKIQTTNEAYLSSKALLDQISRLSKKVLTADNDIYSQTMQSANLTRTEYLPFTSTDNDAKEFISARSSMLSLFSKATGEKGTLTDVDVERIKKALPGYSDNSELAKNKVADLDAVLKSVVAGSVNSYIGTHSNNVNQPLNNTPSATQALDSVFEQYKQSKKYK